MEEKQRQHDEEYHRCLVDEAITKHLGFAMTDKEPIAHGPYLEVDGLTFAYPAKYFSDKDLRLVYRCRRCRNILLSPRIVDIAHLGELIDKPVGLEGADKVIMCDPERHKKHILAHYVDVAEAPCDSKRVLDL